MEEEEEALKEPEVSRTLQKKKPEESPSQGPKMLSELAVNNAAAFTQLVDMAKKAIA